MKKANNQISARRFQKRNKNKFVIINIVGLIILIAGYFLNNLFLGVLVFVGLFLFSNEYLQKANVWKLGAEGEEKVINQLRKLDNSYKVFNDVSLYDRFEIKSNIDHIVIGNNGIFVIETKNHNGIITCKGDNWSQDKVGMLGTPYKGGLKNPSRQVKRNAVLLKEFIDSHEVSRKKRLWINAILVFTNKEAELSINNPTVPVLRPEALCDHIKNYKSGINLTKDEVESIGNLVNKIENA